MSTKRPVALIAAILAVFALSVAGCSADQDSGSMSREQSIGSDMGGAPAFAPNEKAPADSPQTPQADRKEIVTGSVYLTTKDPIDASHRAADRVTVLGGRVDQRTENPETDHSQAHSQLVVRVPADKTEQFIDELSDFGEVTNISLNRSDVTMQYQDLDARTKALQTSVNRLQTLLEGATETSDLIEIETALSQRQAELDSLNAQLRSLNDQIDLSTLTLDFATTDQSPPSEPDSFWDGLVEGWNALTSALHAAWVNLGRVVPWAALAIIIGIAGWGIVRTFAGARSKRTPKMPPAAGAQPVTTPPRPVAPPVTEKTVDSGPDQAK